MDTKRNATILSDEAKREMRAATLSALRSASARRGHHELHGEELSLLAALDVPPIRMTALRFAALQRLLGGLTPRRDGSWRDSVVDPGYGAGMMTHPAFSFGRPAALGNPITDMADKVVADVEGKLDAYASAAVNKYGTQAADAAIARFEQRSQEIVDDLAPKINAKLETEVQKILASADTQTKLGEAQAQFQSGIIKVAAVSAVLTVAATWAAVKYL